jgi:thiamine-monophosphate kinase
MKELIFLDIIKNTLTSNAYIGDDCAYLEDLGLVVTHDNLVEDIHFSLKFATPYQLGYKAIMVNLSDIFASGAMPKYVTIALSLPSKINYSFVTNFYDAVNDLSKKFDFEVIGGDITGSDKVIISICAIGSTNKRRISSRSYAKEGDIVVVTGVHGSSAAGLWLLQNNLKLEYKKIIRTHLMPVAQNKFSSEIATKADQDYAMMDTSDGFVDALFKIAQASNVLISVDLKKVPYDKEILDIAELAEMNYKNWILYGGEDYQLIACIDKKNLNKLDKNTYTIIGQVKEKTSATFLELNFDNKTKKITSLNKTFNHFLETFK